MYWRDSTKHDGLQERTSAACRSGGGASGPRAPRWLAIWLNVVTCTGACAWARACGRLHGAKSECWAGARYRSQPAFRISDQTPNCHMATAVKSVGALRQSAFAEKKPTRALSCKTRRKSLQSLKAYQFEAKAPDVPASWAMSVPRLAKSVGGLYRTKTGLSAEAVVCIMRLSLFDSVQHRQPISYTLTLARV